MQYEEFVLRQLKRNEKIYSVCMKVFLVFMIVFVLALIGILIGGLLDFMALRKTQMT